MGGVKRESGKQNLYCLVGQRSRRSMGGVKRESGKQNLYCLVGQRTEGPWVV